MYGFRIKSEKAGDLAGIGFVYKFGHGTRGR